MKQSVKKPQFILFAILLLAGFSGFAQDANVRGTRADKRQVAQRARIHDGRKDGEVTRREAALLNAEQRHVRRNERRAKADGEVTTQEKRRLERKQDRASRHIRRAKHNGIDNTPDSN